MKFKPLSNPILLISDNPALYGGLSRMGRDLATLLCTLPQFRVGYLGRGIGNKRKFPFTLYDFPESGQWGENFIKGAWEDFADDDYGVIITLDDPSRRHWLANPVGLPEDLAKFLGPGRNFQKWGYFPIDSTGINGKSLSMMGRDCIAHYDRVLAASEWGCNVLKAGGRQDADWLPHGIWQDKFKVRSIHSQSNMAGFVAKSEVGWNLNHIHVGCVMANQSRKDYPAAFECFAALKAEYGNRFQAWLHTNTMFHYWNVQALAVEYGVGDCIEVTFNLNDDQLALRYSACDCTILPSAGEGFGFPIGESLSCGTACVVTDYAAGPELVEESCRVRPMAYRVDTQHNVVRAVLSGYAFAQAAKGQIEEKCRDWAYRSEQLADSVRHLQWPLLKHVWSRWLLDGLK